jgi:colanic acid/amylovoran biosynthesis glycosyltransferase
MKLLYVTAGLPYGPGEAFIIGEVDELMRQGNELRILPTYGRGNVVHDDALALVALTEERRLFTVAIAAGATLAVARAPLRAASTILTIFRSRNLLIFAKNAAVVPKALWLARRLPRLGIDHLHAHWGGTSSTLAMLAAEASGVSWSMTLHRWDIAENNLLATKIARACFVRTISSSGWEEARRRTRAGRGTLTVLPMGVHIGPDPPEPRPAARGRLLLAANFVQVKGHHVALAAVATLRRRGVHLRLDLAGVGPLLAETRELSRRLGLEDSVSFLGQLPHRELLRRLAAREWDVIVLSSIETADGEREGIPVILMEAMATGTPVVAPRVGAIPELLEGGAGLLVPPADPDGLADAVQRLLADGELRARVGAAGRRRVASSHSIASVAAALGERFRACARTLDDAP